MYLYSLAKLSSPSLVRAPQGTIPLGKIRIALIASGMRTPFSGSVMLYSRPTMPRSVGPRPPVHLAIHNRTAHQGRLLERQVLLRDLSCSGFWPLQRGGILP